MQRLVNPSARKLFVQIFFPFGRITGIRFNGYNLSPLFSGHPWLKDRSHDGDDAAIYALILQLIKFLSTNTYFVATTCKFYAHAEGIYSER